MQLIVYLNLEGNGGFTSCNETLLFIGSDPIEEAISTCGPPGPCKDNATACPMDTCLLSGRQFRYYDDDNLGLYNGIHYQNTGSNTSRSVLCHLALDALPNAYQWNNWRNRWGRH